MRDAINIKDRDFHIDGVKTHATDVWITEFNEVYISLKNPKGGILNVSTRDIHKYCDPMHGDMRFDNPENLSYSEILHKMSILGHGENRNKRFKVLSSYSTERIPIEEWKLKYMNK